MTSTIHRHDWRRSGYTGDGVNGYLIIETCSGGKRLLGEECRARRERPATPEEAEAIRQEWAQMVALHDVWHAFSRALDGLSGLEAMEAAEAFAAEHPDGVRLVGCDDSSHMSSYLVLVAHENAQEFMGTTVVYLPQNADPRAEFFLYPRAARELAEALQWADAKARAKPSQAEQVLAKLHGERECETNGEGEGP